MLLTTVGWSGSALESKVKAAYLLNFARFVVWPDDALSPNDDITICSIDSNPFGNLLLGLNHKQVGTHRLQILTLSKTSEIHQCHILYISKSARKLTPEINKFALQHHIFTVSENRNFVESGGIVQFIKQKGRIRFIINNNTAKASRLKVKSQLLELAVKVKK